MAKVRFTEACVTRESRPQAFEAGKVYDLSEDSANHWLIRGKAERVEDAVPHPVPHAVTPVVPVPDPVEPAAPVVPKPRGK